MLQFSPLKPESSTHAHELPDIRGMSEVIELTSFRYQADSQLVEIVGAQGLARILSHYAY